VAPMGRHRPVGADVVWGEGEEAPAPEVPFPPRVPPGAVEEGDVESGGAVQEGGEWGERLGGIGIGSAGVVCYWGWWWWWCVGGGMK
jgi:hypothetical protein